MTRSKAHAEATSVEGVILYRLHTARDPRGALTVAEMSLDMPFQPQRAFLTFEVPTTGVRGEHAHRECHQLLICTAGSVNVIADDGRTRQEFVLDRRDLALYLPPMVWGVQHKHSADAVLLVLASAPYDPEDYIRDYDVFRESRVSSQ